MHSPTHGHIDKHEEPPSQEFCQCAQEIPEAEMPSLATESIVRTHEEVQIRRVATESEIGMQQVAVSATVSEEQVGNSSVYESQGTQEEGSETENTGIDVDLCGTMGDDTSR